MNERTNGHAREHKGPSYSLLASLLLSRRSLARIDARTLRCLRIRIYKREMCVFQGSGFLLVVSGTIGYGLVSSRVLAKPLSVATSRANVFIAHLGTRTHPPTHQLTRLYVVG